MLEKCLQKYKQLPVQMKASFWFLICTFLQKGISIITTPIFTRLMTVEEYGGFNVFNSWLNIIAIIVTLNLSSGVYNQGLVKYEDNRKVYSSSMQGLTLFLVCSWGIIYIFFHNFFDSIFLMSSHFMVLMLIIIWSNAIFQFWASEQRVEYKYVKLVIITLVVSITTPILGILLINIMRDKVTARILSIAIISFISYFWLFLEQTIKGKSLYKKTYWSNALKFGIPLIPHYLSQVVLSSSDRIMIEKMCGLDGAGIYSLAYSLSLIMTFFNSALMQTMSPWIYKKIKDNKINNISKVAYTTLIFIAMINIALIAIAPEVVSVFAPVEYHDAIWIIPPVSMSVFFMFAYDLFAKFEFYFEKTKIISIATAIGAILNITLNYFLIPIYGYYAAGYTTLFCYIIYAFVHYAFMMKICKDKFNNQYPYNNKIIICISILFLTIGFSFLLLYKYTIIRYILVLVIMITLIAYRKKIYKLANEIIKSKEW